MLKTFLEEAADITRELVKTGSFLPRGGTLFCNETPSPCRVISSPNVSRAPPEILNLTSSSTGFTLVRGGKLRSQVGVLLPIHQKGTSEETETPELKFYTIEDAIKYIQAQKIYVTNQAFRTAPKIVAPLKICTLCKTFKSKHRPESCTNTRCAKCSGNHGAKDHLKSDTRLK